MQWMRGQWDRVGAWVLIAVGALALVLGWLGVRSEALTQKQIPYIISGGIGGILLAGVGAMLWLSADLRDEWRKLDAIERKLSSANTDASDDPFAEQNASDPQRQQATTTATSHVGNTEDPTQSSRAARRPKLRASS